MEQFRQIGEVLGSLKALMVFKENIQFNQRQCSLLLDVFSYAYDLIANEITQNLKFTEKQTKWKVLEQPLKEIHKIFKEGEAYIKQCLETKDWWAKAITRYRNKDCVEFYIHNLICCIPIVIEAIESAGEISGRDQDEMQRKRLINSNKYRKEYRDMKLFQWKFGKQYLITQAFCNHYDTVWKEDRWFLLNKIREKKIAVSTKCEDRLTDVLLQTLEGSESLGGELLPISILVGSKDYQARRRLGNGSQYKEIIWLGESFVIKIFFGDIEALESEITSLLSLSHPNIMECLCGFSDEEKKECFLLMELMSRNLSTHIKEICGSRKRIPFALSVAVDLMLQIARGMEYLTKKCWHTDPHQRPSFSSVCRILRYVKRFLAMNPDYNSQPDPPVPPVDYWDIESTLLRKFPSWKNSDASPISQIPFQMFASGEELFPSVTDKKSLVGNDSMTVNRKLLPSRRSFELKATRQPG